MKKLALTAVAGMLMSLLVASFASAEMAEVKVGKGTLKMGGILQAGYTYHMEDLEGTDAFTLNRARFLFWGDIVPDKVKYFVQLDHKGGTSVLDYKARFFYIEKTEIAVGRFLPNFTLFMPVSTAKLEMINYPLTTQKFATWRQVGIQTTTKTEYVDFNLGVFNGADQPNNFSDNNDAKDFLLRADIKPPIEQANVRFGGYAWIGYSRPLDDELFPGTDTAITYTFAEETLKNNRFGGFAKVDYEATEKLTLKFRGEFLMASSEGVLGYTPDTVTMIGTVDSVSTTDAQAFFVHLGVQPCPRLEFLVRYDFYDPNTDLSYDAGVTADDETTWITGGVNYYLEGLNAMFYLNYIRKMESGKNADGSDREFDNDLVVGQVQILF